MSERICTGWIVRISAKNMSNDSLNAFYFGPFETQRKAQRKADKFLRKLESQHRRLRIHAHVSQLNNRPVYFKDMGRRWPW